MNGTHTITELAVMVMTGEIILLPMQGVAGGSSAGKPACDCAPVVLDADCPLQKSAISVLKKYPITKGLVKASMIILVCFADNTKPVKYSLHCKP